MRRQHDFPRVSSVLEDPQSMRQRVLELKTEKRAIMESIDIGILLVHGGTGEILEANTKALLLSGYKESELIGLPVKDLLPFEYTGNGIQNTGYDIVPYIKNNDIVLQRANGDTMPVIYSACFINMDEDSELIVTIQDKRKYTALAEQTGGDASRKYAHTPEVIDEFPNIIGKSDNIRNICRLIGKVSKTDCTVLLQGESGTGKEIIAQAIHYHSLRVEGPFVKVNCAALSETLLESELFGHVKGSFTGAIRERKGRFRQAEGGTIMLDEIGCMSLSGQTKLLRVLQEREYEPVGSNTTIKADIRIIATTNVNLKEAVEQGLFREDLYYRLSVITMHLSPLRKRSEDITLLAYFFLRQANEKSHKNIKGFHPTSLDLLLNHHWPGNVRELENVIEHSVIVEEADMIRPSSLPIPKSRQYNSRIESLRNEIGLKERLGLIEKQIVLQTLENENWVKHRAARALGIDPRNFSYFLKKHNITENMTDRGSDNERCDSRDEIYTKQLDWN